MNAFVNGVKTLFTGPDTSAQQKQIADTKQQQDVAAQRQLSTEQATDAQADTQLGKAPRGRRLLQAATGDAGVASTLGGGS